MKKIINWKKGFTLLEVLIVIGIIAILASVAMVAINPSRQFMMARDSERLSNVESIANAINQNVSENKGLFKCSGVVKAIPSTSTIISSAGLDIAKCIVPDYLALLPIDPSDTEAYFKTDSDYNTKYSIYRDTNNRLNIIARGEMATSIKAIR